MSKVGQTSEAIADSKRFETFKFPTPAVKKSAAPRNVFSKSCFSGFAVVVAVAISGVVSAGAQQDLPKANPPFVKWLKDYIPATHSDARIIDHGGWVQGRIPGLVASWAQWNEDGITLKEVHDVEEGESLFISKETRTDWPESASVVYFDGVGYYIAGYSSATMAEWDVQNSTVVQYDGDSKNFTEQMAKARSESLVPLAGWLKSYIPARYPSASIEDHGGWAQAKLPDGLVVSWAQWNESGITLRGIEAHALKEGRSIFISKPGRENWAGGPSVVYFDGAGYYVGAYSSATMSTWNVEKSTVIQFDGDSRRFSEELAKAWVAAN